MRFLNKIIFILFFSSFANLYVYGLTNSEITQLCRKERKIQECIREFKIRRYYLKRGKPIEIPVEPFKR